MVVVLQMPWKVELPIYLQESFAHDEVILLSFSFRGSLLNFLLIKHYFLLRAGTFLPEILYLVCSH